MPMPHNLLVVDVETTGPNILLHEVLSVAFVPIVANCEPLVLYVRTPDHMWSAYAKTNFARFDREWTEHAVPPAIAATRIEEYVAKVTGNQQTTLVGHNVGFDLAFLRKLAARAGREDLLGISHRCVDTHTLLFLAWLDGRLPEAALTSDGAFEHFGIRVPAERRHTALADALATREMFLELLQVLAPSAVDASAVEHRSPRP